MATCFHCGAPLSGPAGLTCTFCGVENQPAPAPAPQPVVVNTVVVSGGSAPQVTPTGLLCPRCRRRLASAEAEGITLHGCGSCGGVWLDNEGSRAVVDKGPGTISILAQRAAANARGSVPRTAAAIPCPTCSANLDRVERWGIQVDLCPEHGTWFDCWELQRLVDVVVARRQKEEEDKARVTVEHRMACFRCKKVVAQSETQMTAEGAVCDACFKALELERLASS